MVMLEEVISSSAGVSICASPEPKPDVCWVEAFAEWKFFCNSLSVWCFVLFFLFLRSLVTLGTSMDDCSRARWQKFLCHLLAMVVSRI